MWIVFLRQSFVSFEVLPCGSMRTEQVLYTTWYFLAAQKNSVFSIHKALPNHMYASDSIFND